MEALQCGHPRFCMGIRVVVLFYLCMHWALWHAAQWAYSKQGRPA